MIKTLLSFGAVLLLAASPSPAQAQWAPSKPITIVVPYPPGGSSDVIARVIGKNMSESLKTPVIVDSRPGASTYIATSFVKRTPADGTTLYIVDVPFALTPYVMSSARYDPVKEFTPIALIGTAAQVFWARPNHIASMKALIEQAKAKPGEMALGSGGAGTTVHLMLEILQKQTGIKINHIPYKGSAPQLVDTAGGVVEGGFASVASAKSLWDAGKLVPLAVTSPRRQPGMPDVPTFAELGLPSLSLEHWWGVVGPAGMPADVVQRLNREIIAAVNDPANRDRFVGLAVVPASASPNEFGRLIESDAAVWSAVARDANVRID